MKAGKWQKKVGDVFTIERHVNASYGFNFVLAGMTGGIVLIDIDTQPLEISHFGGFNKKIFVFKCIQEGDASIQFACYRASEPDKILFEDVLPVEIIPLPCRAPGMQGGWTEFKELGDEERKLFDSVMSILMGVEYTPLKFSTQIVNGVKYCFLCDAVTLTKNPEKFSAEVTIYKSTNGEVYILSIKTC